MSSPNIKNISVHELKSKMDTANICLIDVREQGEWQELHIPGAILIPKDTLPAQIEQQVSDKTQPIYLHCRGGVRSLQAAQTLIEMGYKEVYSIDGGILEWAQSGYPVVEVVV